MYTFGFILCDDEDNLVFTASGETAFTALTTTPSYTRIPFDLSVPAIIFLPYVGPNYANGKKLLAFQKN